jgi:hypothetical protein
MTERPIIFSGEMVRAILGGRKTQTRRVMRVQPPDDRCQSDNIYFTPRCQVGDHLWVRETFRHFGNIKRGNRPVRSQITYQADGETKDVGEWDSFVNAPKQKWWHTDREPWTPSIHMPRWASRITLLVKSVRAERLQDITPADAKAEGDKERSGFPEFHEWGAFCHVRWFRSLWNSINAKRGYGWDTNPWVWVYGFERIDEEGER